MKTIYFVLPVLFILMLGLGIELKSSSFISAIKNPKPLLVGLTAQILLLPAITFLIIYYLDIPTAIAVGIMLIAACPGGTSSNILSMLAGGDAALSVMLTFTSSFITLITLPFIVNIAFTVFYGSSTKLQLSVPQTIIQNFILIILPIICGYFIRKKFRLFADKLLLILKKISLPLLIIMILIFTYNQKVKLLLHGFNLLIITFLYICLALLIASLISRAASLSPKHEKTIIIEITIQNAALAISIAASPYLLNNPEFAVPAIVYAVLMNIIAFSYTYFIKMKQKQIINQTG